MARNGRGKVSGRWEGPLFATWFFLGFIASAFVFTLPFPPLFVGLVILAVLGALAWYL